MKRILAIDDTKPHLGATKIARTFEEGIQALEEESWDVLWLDWNLGECDETGFDVLRWLKRNPVRMPKEIIPVSADPSANSAMAEKIKELRKNKT